MSKELKQDLDEHICSDYMEFENNHRFEIKKRMFELIKKFKEAKKHE